MFSDQGAWWENAIIALLDRDTQPVSFLVREVSVLDLFKAIIMVYQLFQYSYCLQLSF